MPVWFRIRFPALAALLHGPDRPSTYWITRALFLRALGAVYVVAFLVAWHQAVPLIGERGLMPAPRLLERAGEALSPGSERLFGLPTLFWYGATDRHLTLLSGLGLALALAVVAGLSSWIVMLALWVLYTSLANVGQTFWGFGWEIMLLEAGWMAAFLCPAWGGPRSGHAPPPAALMVLYRWMLFRVIFGAGLIKLRGDDCWRDFTCLAYHYETQPVPNPLSRYLHQAPLWFHQLGCAFNHVVELYLPWFLFAPRRLRHVAGCVQALFQVMLILSGNLSFLNWLTLAICLPCFDDQLLSRFLPAGVRDRLLEGTQKARPGIVRQAMTGVAVLAVVVLSWKPVANMLSPGQIMNTSFDRFHLVNTYGAFGNVGRVRHEVSIEGTDAALPGEEADWREYGFHAKPGDPMRRPPWISPYHYRLDWQIWFAAMSVYPEQPWLVHLAQKLLEADPGALSLLREDPFAGKPPRWIRMILHEYRYTSRGQAGWWTRRRVRPYLPPVQRNNPSLAAYLRANNLAGPASR